MSLRCRIAVTIAALATIPLAVVPWGPLSGEFDDVRSRAARANEVTIRHPHDLGRMAFLIDQFAGLAASIEHDRHNAQMCTVAVPDANGRVPAAINLAPIRSPRATRRDAAHFHWYCGAVRGDTGRVGSRAISLSAHPSEAACRGTGNVGSITSKLLASSSQAVGAGQRAARLLEPYRLGVFPYAHVLTIDRIYGPLAAQLAENLGRPVLVKTKSTTKDFQQALRQETYEIIVVHGFFYVEAVDTYHYLPLVRLDKPPMSAVVLVREDDPATVPGDLVGRTISLPPEFSGIDRLVKGALIEHGLAPRDFVLKRHTSDRACLRALAMGALDACGGPNFVMSRANRGNELRLRTLLESRSVNSHVIAAHARVPKVERDAILRSILAWSESPDATAILPGGPWKRFIPAKDSDYDTVRYYVSELREFAGR